MEQPNQGLETGAGASHAPPVGRASPGAASSHGTPKSRRIPKVHKKNERGETPLHVAARRGEHRLCKKLLQEGALVNANDYAGWTPLHEACSHAHFKVAKVLISGGADVNACSESFDTPLHDASSNGCEKLAWLLLHAGADRDRRNNAGKRPIELCPAECTGLRALLAATTLPDRCPSDGGDASPRSPLAAHHLDGSQSLSVSVRSPGGKPPQASPAGTDITVHSDMCVRGDGRDTPLRSEAHCATDKSEDLLSTEASWRSGDRGEEGAEGKEASIEGESIKSETHDRQPTGKVSSPPVTRRSTWREDKDVSAGGRGDVSAGVRGDVSAGGRGDVSAVGRGDVSARDVSAGGESGLEEEGSRGEEGESRGRGRPRGVPRKERFSSQPPSTSPSKTQPTNDKRKQRGRRRGRGGSSVVSNSASNPPPQTAPVDDVYEFRSSPESDINISKGVGEGTSRETSAPPAAKRQRITQPPTDFSQEDADEVPGEDQDDAGTTGRETTDDKGAPSGRKVPPLRISLPRTPSEDGMTVGTGEESNPATSNTNRKRGPKPHRKQPSPDDALGKAHDDTAQRVTRSKLRQSGRQLREQGPPSYDGSGSGKRKGGYRRGVASATNLSSLAPSLPPNDESNLTSDLPNTANGEDESSGEVGEAPVGNDSPTPMSLMQKNTYEGYRGLRAMIEGRWMEAMALPPPTVPDPPPNYDNYMIVNNTYSMGNIDPCPVLKKEESEESLPSKLCALRGEQETRRHKMEVSHKVERERLQMQAEMEMLRMSTRRANPGRDSLSTVRILHEKEVFNSWFLDLKREDKPVLGDAELRGKFDRLAALMQNRQRMESDALYAEQVFTWNKAVQKSGGSEQSSLKGRVPRVGVVPLELTL